MERRRFIRTCSYATIGVPIFGAALVSCGSIHYATSTRNENKLLIARLEFLQVKKNKTVVRDRVLVRSEAFKFPICVNRISEEEYSAVLLECTHRGCELNVGGGIYSCPCHGSEFSKNGEVLEGPAEQDLLIFRTGTDNENIYIYLS